MQFYFCFTLDTEPDNLWSNPSTYTFENLKQLPDFHRRLTEAGARPTYLTTSEVVESPDGRKAMLRCLEDGHCEVGAHLHTWTRQWPFDMPSLGSPPVKAMAHQLGQPIEERMLDYTCQSLRLALGIDQVRSHRGGRWSLGAQSAVSFANCGIEVDTTVTPGITRSVGSGLLDGPDFRTAPLKPFWLTSNGADGEASVLELPVGGTWFPPWTKKLPQDNLSRWLLQRVSRHTGARLGHRWLRPTHVALEDMRATMQVLKDEGVPIWVFIIHSSEIVPCKPLPTVEAVDAFKERCVGAIRAAIELGGKPLMLQEATGWVQATNQKLPSFPASSIIRV